MRVGGESFAYIFVTYIVESRNDLVKQLWFDLVLYIENCFHLSFPGTLIQWQTYQYNDWKNCQKKNKRVCLSKIFPKMVVSSPQIVKPSIIYTTTTEFLRKTVKMAIRKYPFRCDSEWLVQMHLCLKKNWTQSKQWRVYVRWESTRKQVIRNGWMRSDRRTSKKNSGEWKDQLLWKQVFTIFKVQTARYRITTDPLTCPSPAT